MNLLDDRRPERRAAALELLEALAEARAGDATPRVGVTGAPGSGKSTLLDALVRTLRQRNQTVGIVAVDPSSQRSGGALLGDRFRVRAGAGDPGVFLRSMAARTRLGGLADGTWAAASVLAAVFDRVFVETVGVGQSEAEVADLVDTLLFVVQPGAGDVLQFMKAGVLELPDLFVVNKSDLGAPAERTAHELEAGLGLGGSDRSGFGLRVLLASARDGAGIGQLIDALDAHARHLVETGALTERRKHARDVLVRDGLRARYGSYGLDAVGGAASLDARLAAAPERSPFAWLRELGAEIEDALREAFAVKSAIRAARVRRILERTLDNPTAPYREGEVIGWVREFVAARESLALREDVDGNLYVRRRGVRASPSPLVLSAHMDHPGFRALRSKPTQRGQRVEALFLGGVRPSFLPGARARFHVGNGGIRATVRSTRPDARSGEQRVLLDARERVPAGAFGTWDLPGFRRSRRNPDLIETRAADDLAGVAAILALMESADAIDSRRRVDVRGLFTRAEEVGFVGALAVARGKRLPRGARIVAVEASKALRDAPQGAGPILRVGDRTSIFDDGLTRWIGRVGARLERRGRFSWQRKLMDGGTCEASAFQLYGYRCAGMCLPLGNYHNMGERGRIAAETIRLSDCVGLVRFFEGLVRADGDAPRADRVDPLRKRLDHLLERRRANLARDPFA